MKLIKQGVTWGWTDQSLSKVSLLGTTGCYTIMLQSNQLQHWCLQCAKACWQLADLQEVLQGHSAEVAAWLPLWECHANIILALSKLAGQPREVAVDCKAKAASESILGLFQLSYAFAAS